MGHATGARGRPGAPAAPRTTHPGSARLGTVAMGDRRGGRRRHRRANVTAWLVDHVEGAVAPFRFDVIAGGHSNLTYRVMAGDGRRLVLRRPPLGHVLASAHDMGREHRIIAGLQGSRRPVPPSLGLLRRHRRQRCAVLRHGLRRRHVVRDRAWPSS